MARPRRSFLGKRTTVGFIQSVFLTADALEIDNLEYFQVRRTRIFFDELQLVTYHRRVGTAFVVTCGLLALAVALVALAVGAVNDEWVIAGVLFALVGLPPLLAGVLRAIFQLDVVTAYGKRGWGRMEFAFRKEHAREVYLLIGRLAREHQERVARDIAAEQRRQAAPSADSA